MKILPINLDELIHTQSVESVRLEFKKSWSEPTLEQITRTVCALANDFLNLNGGYIILGIEEQGGQPVLPPSGLDALDIEKVQQEIRWQCNRIDPAYQPILSPEIYQGKSILVIWAPAGDIRPYQAPTTVKGGERVYYVRHSAQTVEAKGDTLNQLLQMTAKIPFDDRRNIAASVDLISPSLVRNFLANIKSDLVALGVNIPDKEIYHRMRLTTPVNEHEVPKNIALLFFVNDPEQFFPGARIEVVQFGDEPGGDLIEEKIFRGPLNFQINQVLEYLNTFSTTLLRKVPGQAEVYRTVAFPYEAMEEAIVNAVYHRGYDGIQEPTKVYLYPDRMEIISYPGPVPGIELKHLQPGAFVPPVPNRNRRIGELLKELRLAEGRGTGIPKIRRKMDENGSPAPHFEFDEERTYFRVVLPAHPQYIVLQALRESSHLWAIGERQKALVNLTSAQQRVPVSGALIAQLIEYQGALGNTQSAETLFSSTDDNIDVIDRHLPYLAMARLYLDRQDTKRASQILERAPSAIEAQDIIERAILLKRAGKYESAHRIFAENFDFIKDDPKAVHEYAQTKIQLSGNARHNPDARRRLNREAEELLRRAIQLTDDPTRCAWCYYDLARVLNWLKAPEDQILQAYTKAISFLPGEERIRQAYERWRRNGTIKV